MIAALPTKVPAPGGTKPGVGLAYQSTVCAPGWRLVPPLTVSVTTSPAQRGPPEDTFGPSSVGQACPAALGAHATAAAHQTSPAMSEAIRGLGVVFRIDRFGRAERFAGGVFAKYECTHAPRAARRG